MAKSKSKALDSRLKHAGMTPITTDDWHPADIKAALEKRGWSLSMLARHHGIRGSSAISHTFLRSYPINEKRIADAIGVHPMVIWPSRYLVDGSKKSRGIRGMRDEMAVAA